MHRLDKMIKAMPRRVGGVAVGLFIVTFGVLAAGAAIQHALHHDAPPHAGHCALCAFAQGQMESADALVAAGQPIAPAGAAGLTSAGCLRQNPSFLLPLGRAPPAPLAVS